MKRFSKTGNRIARVLSAFLATMTCLQPLDAVYINRFNTTTNGYISYTGNTLQLSKLSGQNQPGNLGSGGAFITINGNSQVGSYPDSTTPVAGTTLNWAQDSSSAVLDLPPGSTVLYAELIWSGSYGWGGQIPYDPANPSTFIPSVTSVSLTNPQGVASSVAPDPTTFQIAVTPGFTHMGNYVASADVTGLITGSGIYVVGGVPATIVGSDDNHNAAGWTLAVAYSNPNMLTSNLTIFVGCEQASNNNPPAEVSGFCAPASGTKNARLFVSAIEGDYGISGDQMRFGPNNPLTASNAVSGSNNPINNFFGSQINTLLPLVPPSGSSIITPSGSSLLDTRGSYGLNNFPTSGSFPNNFGRQGWDITSVDVSNQVNYNQTVAYAQGTTTGDDYTINSLGLAISVGSPILNFDKTVNGQPSVILDGTALPTNVTFEFTITNNGTADASNCSFTDPLETGLTYIPGSATLNGSPTTNPPINVGTLGVGQSATITFEATVTAYPPVGQSFYTNAGVLNYEFFPCGGATPTDLTANSSLAQINFLPVANPDTGTTDMDTPLSGASVLTNDIGSGLTVTSYSPATSQGGTVTVNPDGTYLYNPPSGFSGTDTFTYTITDEFGNTSSTTVTITVKSTATPPVANPDYGITQKNIPLSTGSVLDNDVGENLVVTTTGTYATSQGGTVTMQSDGNYTYVPPLNFVGYDTFPYSISGTGGTSSSTVTIKVYQYEAPVANPDFGTTNMNTPFDGPSVLENDTGDGITLVSNTQGTQGGTVVMNEDGTYVYTPPRGFVGVDTFTYTIKDIFGNTAMATVTITVLPLYPADPSGTIKQCKLLNKTQYTLQIKWTPSQTPTTVAYNIYSSGNYVATVPANGRLEYTACLGSSKGAGRYQIAAVDQSGLESARVNVEIN